MAITASRTTVTTTAVKLAENLSTSTGASDYTAFSFAFKNVTGTDVIYVGPAGVTSSTGFAWAVADGPLCVDIEPGEEIWGVVVTTSQVVHVLKQGR